MPRLFKYSSVKTATRFFKLNEHYRKRRLKKNEPLADRYRYTGDVEAEKTIKVVRKSTAGVPRDTPWGVVTVTKSKKGGDNIQLMISTNRNNYPNSSSGKSWKWGRYATWAKVLDGHPNPQGVAQDILNQMKGGGPLAQAYTDDQKRAAGSLFMTISTSEEYRVDGSRKFGRATLEAIVKGRLTFEQAFGADDPAFSMAAPKGGTEFTRELGEMLRKPTGREAIVAEYFSDSDSDSDG